jgi:serine/threonine protein kinase
MDSNRWKRIEEIYHALLSQPPERRAAELAMACSDAAMRDELESLLAAREEAGNFLSLSMRGQVLSGAIETPLPVPGESLGSYHILAEAGAGAMGQVYRALDTRLEREVALKVLPPYFARDSERVTRFRVEARAASALNHPNIVTIYDIGEAADTLFIATEWIDGATLRERIAVGQLPFEDMVDIAKQCAAGLGPAHRAGIIHRDIKPQNIMIRSDGLVKLLDFGLARMDGAAGGSPTATASGTVLGTPRYMSPEQAKGQKLDARTDVFSLGVVLYEMAHGHPAFPGDTAAEVFAELLSPSPVAASSSGSGLDPVRTKALQKDPEKRYQTIDALAEDLRVLGLDGRVAVVPEHRRKRRLTWLAAGAAAAVLLVAAAVLYAPWRRQPVLSDSDTILLADFVNQTGDPVFDVTLKEGLAVQLEQSPRLDVFPDDRVRARLRSMRRSPEDPITPQVAREICQREGLKALVTGAIAPLGSHYGITLTAIDSLSGNTLAQVQVEAQAKKR